MLNASAIYVGDLYIGKEVYFFALFVENFGKISIFGERKWLT